MLIDLTPEALIARLRAGKVYRPERVPAALNNFFKIENLAALRETALRQVAEDVEVKRLVREPDAGAIVRRDEEGCPARAEAGPQAIAERLLALATLAPHSERVVRRAWRSAQRLDAELDVLVVRPPGRPPSPEDRERLEALRRLVGDARRAPARRGGRGRGGGRRRGRARARQHLRADGHAGAAARARARSAGDSDRSLLVRLLRELPGVDVRIVADPTLRGRAAEAAVARERGRSRRRRTAKRRR